MAQQKKEPVEKAKEILEPETEVISGQFLDQVRESEPEQVDISLVRVKTLGKAEEPPISEDGKTYYYGMVLPNGLQEVKMRTVRGSKSGIKYNDCLMWYELPIVVDGIARKLAYHIVHEPSPHELFSEYFYPATQWNISQKLRMDQDHEPGWKKMVAMEMANVQQLQPYLVSGNQLTAYHFVIINQRYTPIEGPGGRRIDGVWVMHPPVEGGYIKSYRDAIVLLGGQPANLPRQRVADDSMLASNVR